jgi:hypothetical protein
LGLYLDLPDKALVFCCDEKSQVQALERTQPGSTLGIGHIRMHLYDYICNGAVTIVHGIGLSSRTLGQLHRAPTPASEVVGTTQKYQSRNARISSATI